MTATPSARGETRKGVTVGSPRARNGGQEPEATSPHRPQARGDVVDQAHARRPSILVAWWVIPQLRR